MRNLFRFIRIFLLPQLRYFLLALLTGLIASAANGIGLPFMIYAVFPIIFNGTEAAHDFIRPFIAGWAPGTILFIACSCMPFVFILRGVAMWINSVVVNLLALNILESIRLSVFTHIQSLPFTFLDKQRKGDLLSRVISDTQNVQLVISHTSNDIIKQPITCIAALASFFFLIFQEGAGWLFIVNLLFVFLAVYPVIVFGKRISKRSRQAQDDLGEMSTILQQNLETQREIRAYGLESRQIDDFTYVTDVYGTSIIKVVKYKQALIPLMEVITAIALALLLAQGKLSGMSLSDFLAMGAALYMAFDSIKRAGRAFNRINEAQGALTRLTEVLNEPNTMPDPSFPKQWTEPVKGDISLRNVSFSYRTADPNNRSDLAAGNRPEGENAERGDERIALRHINLDIPAGQIVGLVGPSGAGKTSFANLILRFYDVTQGQIRLDGIDIRDVTQHDLREQIALVGQHAILFAGSIRENIALGNPKATAVQIGDAARAASLGSFLDEAPKGLDTPVGEAGQSLSGGQRQRVAIARAFVKDAPILILDEATASLDAKSEREIQESLERLAKGRTTLIVAHRFSTLRHADRILVFDHGEIVGDGSHDELYEGCPLYRELYDKQSIDN